MGPLTLLALILLITFLCIVSNKKKELQKNYDITLQQNNVLKQQNSALKSKLTQIESMEAEVEQLNSHISELKEEKKLLEKKIGDLTADYSELIIFMVGIEDDESITSQEVKNKLSMLKLEQSEMVKNNEAVIITQQPAKKSVLNNDIKQMLKCFNSETAFILSNTTVRNIDTSRNKIVRSFESINSIFKTDFVQLSDDFLELKLKELNLYYSYLLKVEQEKEEQKAIRQQMIEEEKARREIEREKLKLDKEEKQFHNEINKLMAYLQKANDIEKQLYVDKINELESKLKNLEKDKETLLEREKSTRAGYVYVISNIGSFGEDVYKIGMTRRLEPMDRVKELGDASVPFEFDVHAMIFSEDAPALEATLHSIFKDMQVNKVNPRKEFFRVSLDKIESVVKREHNATVQFTKIAQADQYRRSLALAEQTV